MIDVWRYTTINCRRVWKLYHLAVWLPPLAAVAVPCGGYAAWRAQQPAVPPAYVAPLTPPAGVPRQLPLVPLEDYVPPLALVGPGEAPAGAPLVDFPDAGGAVGGIGGGGGFVGQPAGAPDRRKRVCGVPGLSEICAEDRADQPALPPITAPFTALAPLGLDLSTGSAAPSTPGADLSTPSLMASTSVPPLLGQPSTDILVAAPPVPMPAPPAGLIFVGACLLLALNRHRFL